MTRCATHLYIILLHILDAMNELFSGRSPHSVRAPCVIYAPFSFAKFTIRFSIKNEFLVRIVIYFKYGIYIYMF